MSTLKVIKTDQDHDAALARVASLMNSPAGTPEADELEVLVTLIEAYESKHHPIEPPHPIDAIKFRMEQAGLTQKDLVPFIGSRSKVSEVLSGRRTLNVRMIRALHDGLGIPLASLVGTKAAGGSPELLADLAKHAPVAVMAKRGWFPGFPGFLGTGQARRAEATSLLAKFLGDAGADSRHGCLTRRSSPRDGTSQPGAQAALTAWQARVIQLAGSATLPAFDPEAITPGFARQLVGLSLLDSGPVAAGEYLAKHGIALVVLAHLPTTRLDGSAMRLKSGTPIIGLTLRHDRLDHFWFTLLHEVGHVALHLKDGTAAGFLDDLDGAASPDSLEREADAFAAEALIPSSAWKDARIVESTDAASVSALAQRLRIHVAIVAGRVRREHNDFRRFSRLVGSGELRRLFPELAKGQRVGE